MGDDVSGIYQIINIKNGKKYIGASVRVNNRLHEHRRKLEGKRHPNKSLQKDFNENPNLFSFELIHKIKKHDDLKDKEEYYINFYRSFENGYNQTKKSGYSAERSSRPNTFFDTDEIEERREKRIRIRAEHGEYKKEVAVLKREKRRMMERLIKLGDDRQSIASCLVSQSERNLINPDKIYEKDNDEDCLLNKAVTRAY